MATSDIPPTSHPSSLGNWLRSMTWQIDFTRRLGGVKRSDGENDWDWFERITSFREHTRRHKLRSLLRNIRLSRHKPTALDWLHQHADKLWHTRAMLADDVSRLCFDASLVLRLTSHRRFYFPRIDFDDLVEIRRSAPFDMDGLPKDYLGLPLRVSDLTLRMPGAPAVDLRAIVSDGMLSLVNSYRQYLVTRNGMNISPTSGEVVLDCGACIGDMSLLFAGMVGREGQVHAFDPLPLHNRYCALQAKLNPEYAAVLHFNAFAVGARSSQAQRRADGSQQITPGLRVDETAFDCISLDDYAASRVPRVDFIKMDIEGAELAALEGARDTIRSFKPRLAISGYHEPEHLWEIPAKIKALNPNYVLSFGHHSPMQWESVFYAVDARARSLGVHGDNAVAGTVRGPRALAGAERGVDGAAAQ